MDALSLVVGFNVGISVGWVLSQAVDYYINAKINSIVYPKLNIDTDSDNDEDVDNNVDNNVENDIEDVDTEDVDKMNRDIQNMFYYATNDNAKVDEKDDSKDDEKDVKDAKDKVSFYCGSGYAKLDHLPNKSDIDYTKTATHDFNNYKSMLTAIEKDPSIKPNTYTRSPNVINAKTLRLSRKQEIDILTDWREKLVGLDYEKAEIMVEKSGYKLHIIYVNDDEKRVANVYKKNVLGVRIYKSNDKKIIEQVVDVGGQDIHNRGIRSYHVSN